MSAERCLSRPASLAWLLAALASAACSQSVAEGDLQDLAAPLAPSARPPVVGGSVVQDVADGTMTVCVIYLPRGPGTIWIELDTDDGRCVSLIATVPGTAFARDYADSAPDSTIVTEPEEWEIFGGRVYTEPCPEDVPRRNFVDDSYIVTQISGALYAPVEGTLVTGPIAIDAVVTVNDGEERIVLDDELPADQLQSWCREG